MREIYKRLIFPFYDHFNGLDMDRELPRVGTYAQTSLKKGGN